MDSSSTHQSTSLVAPSNKRPRCDNMSSDPEGDEVQLQKLEEKLTTMMGYECTAKLLLDLTVPLGVKLQNGDILKVLALPGEAKKLMADPIVSVWPLKRQTASEAELRHLIQARELRDLVDRDLSQYEYLSDDLCQRTFHKDGQEIAQKLAGALIQTETQVMLVLKVELFGRTQSEDPHSHDLALPAGGLYVVEATTYEDTRRILVGTATWSALVTSAIILTTDDVIVGPDNTTFQTNRKSVVWVRKDWSKNSVVERHLLSKYHMAITIESFAGVFFLFMGYECQPVTVKTLWSHYINKEQDGTRAIARIFYEFYRKEGLSIAKVKSVLRKTKNADIGDPHVISGMKSLIKAMGDQDRKHVIKVNPSMNECLESFAKDVQETIATLNQDCVRKEIEARIKEISLALMS
ncbi:hypothetical protein BGX21_002323 [Mortierella sp. AD011]|nr:hypothetical protein BGX20_010993 [Mortierella sp. AD010]KAF9401234.1 hypothetical protein BGX21_002323 [Mortierella sp. AD011]